MTQVTVIGAGNMGAAIAGLARRGGAQVQVLTRDRSAAEGVEGVTPGIVGDPITGEIVVLALPYGALADVASAYGAALEGKTVVDISNPLDFSTFDSLVVPADSSAAAELATLAPGARVLKAFNTNFAATLASGSVDGSPTTVLVAGDDADAKDALLAVVRAAGLRALDAGSLRRARELEALGFLQLTLAASEKTSWTGGFTLTE